MAEYYVRVGRCLPGTGGNVHPEEMRVEAETPEQALALSINFHEREYGGTWVGLSVYLRVWAWYDMDDSDPS